MATAEPDAKRAAIAADLQELRAAERRTQRELLQQRRRESAIVLRLALKERENAELCQLNEELRGAAQPPHSQAKTLLLDPAVNAEIMRMREEVKASQKREREAHDELQASQFQSGSIAGKKLVQKCKELQAENEQLGLELSEGRVQKLKADAALQKVRRARAPSRSALAPHVAPRARRPPSTPPATHPHPHGHRAPCCPAGVRSRAEESPRRDAAMDRAPH